MYNKRMRCHLEVIDSFISIYATRTQTLYYTALGQWKAFIGVNFLNATPADVRKFTGQLLNKQHRYRKEVGSLSYGYIAQTLMKLRQMYSSLVEVGIIEMNPFPLDLIAHFRKKYSPRHAYQLVPFESVRKVMSMPDLETCEGVRDAAMLAILFNTAARQSEVRLLRMDALKKTHKGTYFIHFPRTKNGKDRRNALADWALDSVFRNIAQRLAQGAKDSDLMFMSYHWKQVQKAVSVPAFIAIFRKYIGQAGLNEEEFSPHCSRATAISKHLEDGGSYRSAMELSGHSSVQMIELYDKRRFEVDNHPGKTLDF